MSWEIFTHCLKVAGWYIRLSALRQIEYPLFLVSWILLIPVQYISGIWMLSALVRRFHEIGGWTFPELMFLYGIGLLSHSLFVIFFIPVWSTEDMIINGGFDRLLVRPLNVFFQFAVQSFNLIGFVDLLPAMIIILKAKSMLHIPTTCLFVCSITLMVVGGTLIRVSMYTVLGAVAFWTHKSKALITSGASLLDKITMYPQTIAPHFLQIFLTYVIPIGFISFFPAQFLLNKHSYIEFDAPVPMLSIGVGFASFSIAQFLFLKGLARYGSSGS